jgi:hypothetical protein
MPAGWCKPTPRLSIRDHGAEAYEEARQSERDDSWPGLRNEPPPSQTRNLPFCWSSISVRFDTGFPFSSSRGLARLPRASPALVGQWGGQ